LREELYCRAFMFDCKKYHGKNKKDYFEGWYFRHTGGFPFSFIAGVCKNKTDTHAFIQYIDLKKSYYFRFDIADFEFTEKDMTVKIKNNVFSLKGIAVELPNIKCQIRYGAPLFFKKSIYCPTAMGPFSYLPMFCRHDIISMKHDYSGFISVDGFELKTQGQGYIEKDRGSKFPDNYFWMHACNDRISVIAAVAWPLIFNIKGYICIVLLNGKQHNLSLYSGGKLKRFEHTDDSVNLLLTKKDISLEIQITGNENARELFAPAGRGLMTKKIKENLAANCEIKIKTAGSEIVLNECAFEMV